MDCLWASFCRDCRAWSTGWAHARRAVWVLAGNPLDHHWRGSGRCYSGFHYSVLLRKARWEIAGPNGERGNWQGWWFHCTDHCVADHDHPVGGGCAGCGECAEGQPVGNFYDCRHHADCGFHGTLFAILAARQSAGSVGDWISLNIGKYLCR